MIVHERLRYFNSQVCIGSGFSLGPSIRPIDKLGLILGKYGFHKPFQIHQAQNIWTGSRGISKEHFQAHKVSHLREEMSWSTELQFYNPFESSMKGKKNPSKSSLVFNNDGLLCSPFQRWDHLTIGKTKRRRLLLVNPYVMQRNQPSPSPYTSSIPC